MRNYFSFLVATLVLLGCVGDCHAQPFTTAQNRLDDLKAAFQDLHRETKSSRRGVERYYDLAIENICNGDESVESSVRDWINQYFARVRDRLVLIRASIEFRTGSRVNIIDRPILEQANTFDAIALCENLNVAGIRSSEAAKVTIKIKIIDDWDDRISAALAGARKGAEFGGARGGTVGSVAGAAIVGVASFFVTKRVGQKDLEA